MSAEHPAPPDERLRHRQERFCRYFVEYANAAVAAKAAGYAPQSARNAGYRLLRQPRIIERIVEIQGRMAKEHCRDVDVFIGKLETVYRRAINDHHFSAAARAVELQAKLSAASEPARKSRSRRATSSPTLPDSGPEESPNSAETSDG